ncbi:C4-dicarboxylate ABC transporter substrate-binding protein [Limnohabitans sp. MORI2]|uniref:TRAP transporter substrate-binding protein n=1 Tax=Limnohabitans sp. MORI2 TaxID=1751150 RepID=UPI002377763E|nr:TRAP transporter substrate-binding protein [Limnohabitans sp. MORI2]BDU58604.1 C4-dicarboxylate ABC transporter substrate-binding protein [Limnohabitans sp. MORI2]
MSKTFLNKKWAIALAASAVFATLPTQAQTVLKMGHVLAKGSHYDIGANVFCENLDKNTQGRYKCQVYPASALGGEREQVEAVQIGTQDLVITSTGPVGNFVPEMKIVDIPFLFRDYDHARKVLDGKIGQDMLAKFPNHGLVALAWSENGFRHMTNNKRPIVSAADASGLKMRTMENKVHMEGYRAFGIQPTPMAFPEVFGALQQGVVDGQENPIPVILASKFSQVQKHLSLTGHVYSPGLIITSPRIMNKLSEADKKAFYDAAAKSVAATRKKVNDDEANGIAQLEREGMQVVKKVNSASFNDGLKGPYANYAKEFGADKIAAIQAVK